LGDFPKIRDDFLPVDKKNKRINSNIADKQMNFPLLKEKSTIHQHLPFLISI
jgi:hypothetical protein